MKLIETDYHYLEDWQYQRIYIDFETLNIHRRQNMKDKDGMIFHTEDILTQNDEGWAHLFRTYGSKTLVRYVKKQENDSENNTHTNNFV